MGNEIWRKSDYLLKQIFTDGQVVIAQDEDGLSFKIRKLEEAY